MKQLGKYELLEPLGRGGYGTVYRARETVLDVERAVKVLHPALLADPDFIERFRREARIAARLDHPHIVPVYELDQAEGSYFLVMKLMPGGSLKTLLEREKRLPFERALQILRQVCSALDFAHRQDLVHRDLKPGNILFEADGSARLADFGFAKALSGASSVSLSASGGLIGTPSYMAPEVWRNQHVSPATDVYSLACVLYEMLTGDILFSGDTPPEIMTKHMLDGPQFPAQWPEDVPEGFQAVMDRALARKPEERWEGAEEMVEGVLRVGVLSKEAEDVRRQAEERERRKAQAREAKRMRQDVAARQRVERQARLEEAERTRQEVLAKQWIEARERREMQEREPEHIRQETVSRQQIDGQAHLGTKEHEHQTAQEREIEHIPRDILVEQQADEITRLEVQSPEAKQTWVKIQEQNEQKMNDADQPLLGLSHLGESSTSQSVIVIPLIIILVVFIMFLLFVRYF